MTDQKMQVTRQENILYGTQFAPLVRKLGNATTAIDEARSALSEITADAHEQTSPESEVGEFTKDMEARAKQLADISRMVEDLYTGVAMAAAEEQAYRRKGDQTEAGSPFTVTATSGLTGAVR